MNKIHIFYLLLNFWDLTSTLSPYFCGWWLAFITLLLFTYDLDFDLNIGIDWKTSFRLFYLLLSLQVKVWKQESIRDKVRNFLNRTQRSTCKFLEEKIIKIYMQIESLSKFFYNLHNAKNFRPCNMQLLNWPTIYDHISFSWYDSLDYYFLWSVEY